MMHKLYPYQKINGIVEMRQGLFESVNNIGFIPMIFDAKKDVLALAARDGLSAYTASPEQKPAL